MFNIQQEGISSYFTHCSKDFEDILKGLRSYLNSKRRFFPRFYFLSDDEILDIMSHSSSTHIIEKHLHKCFYAIEGLQYSDEEDIIGLLSAEGELIPIVSPISQLEPLH